MRKMQYAWWFYSIFLLLSLSGCAALNQDASKTDLGLNPSIDTIKRYTETMMATPSATAEYSLVQRNNFIDNQVMLFNIRYVEYVKKLGIGKKSLDTTYDVTSLGLSLAGTLVGGVQAKENLAAAASLLTGTKLAVDKNFYFDQALPVLVAGMENRRKEVLVRILPGRQSPLSSYSLAQAQTDLAEYEMAGTLDGGIRSLQKQAGAQQERLDARLEALIPATANQIEDKKRINQRIAELKADPNSLAEINRILRVLDSQANQYTTVSDAAADLEARFRNRIQLADLPLWKSALQIF